MSWKPSAQLASCRTCTANGACGSSPTARCTSTTRSWHGSRRVVRALCDDRPIGIIGGESHCVEMLRHSGERRESNVCPGESHRMTPREQERITIGPMRPGISDLFGIYRLGGEAAEPRDNCIGCAVADARCTEGTEQSTRHARHRLQRAVGRQSVDEIPRSTQRSHRVRAGGPHADGEQLNSRDVGPPRAAARGITSDSGVCHG